MPDCLNVEIRELLPEFLHGRLDARDRPRVEEHLASCEECTEELATLQAVRAAFRQAPPVDTAAIVRALPRAHRHLSRRRHVALRIAAAVSFISLGGISLAVARSFFGPKPTIMQVDTAALPDDSGAPSTLVNASSTPVISFAGGVSDLGEADIETLITEIESIEPAPLPEPMDVTQGASGSGPGGTED